MNTVYFPEMKYINVKVSGIEWDNTDDEGNSVDISHLPTAFDSYEVEVDENVDVYQRYTDDNSMSGFEEMCECLVDNLTCEYGFCINGIDSIEIL